MSVKAKALKTLYDHNFIDKAALRRAVPTLITAEEYEAISGESYA